MKSLLQKHNVNKMFWIKPALIPTVNSNSQVQELQWKAAEKLGKEKPTQ